MQNIMMNYKAWMIERQEYVINYNRYIGKLQFIILIIRDPLQCVIMRYKPLSGKRSPHQLRKAISGFPRLADGRGDPLDTGVPSHKLHIFELWGLGEIEGMWHSEPVSALTTGSGKVSIYRGSQAEGNAPNGTYSTQRDSNVSEHFDTKSITVLVSSTGRDNTILERREPSGRHNGPRPIGR